MNNSTYQKPTIDLGRFKWIFILLGFVFAYYTFQLFSYQIINGASYQAQAEDNRTEVISIPTQRGVIYDRNGIVLAHNIPSYNITVTPADLPDSDGATHAIFDKLSDLIGIPLSNGVVNDETAGNFSPCNTDLGIEQIVEIASTNWPFQKI